MPFKEMFINQLSLLLYKTCIVMFVNVMNCNKIAKNTFCACQAISNVQRAYVTKSILSVQDFIAFRGDLSAMDAGNVQEGLMRSSVLG